MTASSPEIGEGEDIRSSFMFDFCMERGGSRSSAAPRCGVRVSIGAEDLEISFLSSVGQIDLRGGHQKLTGHGGEDACFRRRSRRLCGRQLLVMRRRLRGR